MSTITRLTGFFPLALIVAAQTAHIDPALADDAVVLPTIEVDGSARGSLSVPSVPEQRRALERTVGSVGFVDAATPAQTTRAKIDLRDALEDTPGVFVQSRYGQELRVSIRGAGITRGYHLRGIELLQDGIPFNAADGSGDFYQVDPTFYRTIEVYKGGNALAFGTTTLGGAVDFISPTAYTATAPNIVQVDGGSFGMVRGSVQASRVIGAWDFLVGGTFTRSDGFRQHEKQDYQQANGNIGYRFSEGLETRFYWGIYNTNQQLPGQLTLGAALSNPTAAAASAASTGVGGNQSRNELVERIANRTTLALADGRLDVDSWFIHKSLNHPIFQVLDQDGFTAGLAPRWTLGGTIGGFHDDLIFGARAVGGRNAAKQYVNINGQEAAQTLNARQDAVNLEAYAENRFFVLPTVGLMTGAKVFSDQRQYTDFGGLPADPTPKFASATYNGLNPKIGLIWLPRPDVQVFADLTGSRDVPDFTDLTQTTATTTRFVPLAAQRALTVEVGTRGRIDRVSWDVTAYRSDIHDELLQFTTNQSIPAATFNTPHTLHQGIEFGAGVDLLRNLASDGDALTLTQVWTLSDFRFEGSAQYGNNQIAGVPRNVLRTTLGYRGAHGLYVAPTVDWVPQGAYVDYANTLRVPGYALLGLQAGVSVAPGVSLYVDARNLTNARYISDLSTITDARTASTAVFYPGAGRSVYGGVRYTF